MKHDTAMHCHSRWLQVRLLNYLDRISIILISTVCCRGAIGYELFETGISLDEIQKQQAFPFMQCRASGQI